MSTNTYVIKDSSTMLCRNFKHMLRYPTVSLLVIAVPVILLLLFVYVFGGTLGAGLGQALDGRAAYVNYVTPGIILIAIAGAAQGTAISAAMDMTEGIIARFRTMAIARGAVLTGHVVGSVKSRCEASRRSFAAVSTMKMNGITKTTKATASATTSRP